MDVITPLIAHIKAAEVGEPGHGALDHPTDTPQTLAALDADARNAIRDAAAAQVRVAARDVVGLVGMHLLRALTGPSARALDGPDTVERRLEVDRIVAVGRAQQGVEREAGAVDHNVALRARFRAIRRILAGLWPPFLARMLALSTQARLQSIAVARPKRLSSVWGNCSQTPAACQSRSRRQHVEPLPQPISTGSICHGMPVRRTKMIPASAARSGTRGAPPLGLGGSGGIKGAMASHNVSLTNGLLIPYVWAEPVPGSETRSKRHASPAKRVCRRLRLKARQTRHHSPAAASTPRSENCRKPNTSLMMPMTGS